MSKYKALNIDIAVMTISARETQLNDDNDAEVSLFSTDAVPNCPQPAYGIHTVDI